MKTKCQLCFLVIGIVVCSMIAANAAGPCINANCAYKRSYYQDESSGTRYSLQNARPARCQDVGSSCHRDKWPEAWNGANNVVSIEDAAGANSDCDPAMPGLVSVAAALFTLTDTGIQVSRLVCRRPPTP